MSSVHHWTLRPQSSPDSSSEDFSFFLDFLDFLDDWLNDSESTSKLLFFLCLGGIVFDSASPWKQWCGILSTCGSVTWTSWQICMPSQSSCMKQRTAHGQKVCREPINFRSFFRGEANKVKRFHVTVRLEGNLLYILSLNSADKSEKVIIKKSSYL